MIISLEHSLPIFAIVMAVTCLSKWYFWALHVNIEMRMNYSTDLFAFLVNYTRHLNGKPAHEHREQ
jgi:hypothetical protein